jgi:precorrin-6B methylase 2
MKVMKKFYVEAWVEVEARYVVNALTEEDARKHIETMNPVPHEDEVIRCTVTEVTNSRPVERKRNEEDE